MSRPSVQVYILTHNRPQLILESLSSVLRQDYCNLQIILSDNSTNDLTEQITKEISDSRFVYKRRIPALSPTEHFKLVISEVCSDYYLLFHDDDLLAEGAIKKYIEIAQRFPGAVAIGSNAYFIKGNKKTDKAIFLPQKKCVRPTPARFLKQYFFQKNIIPFPSYFYCKKKVNGYLPDFDNGGKHSDVAYLLDLFDRGEIIWSFEPTMFSRLHSGQDSQELNLAHVRKLINYIAKKGIFQKQSFPMRYYKLLYSFLMLKDLPLKGKYQKYSKAFINVSWQLLKIRPLLFGCLIVKAFFRWHFR